MTGVAGPATPAQAIREDGPSGYYTNDLKTLLARLRGWN